MGLTDTPIPMQGQHRQGVGQGCCQTVLTKSKNNSVINLILQLLCFGLIACKLSTKVVKTASIDDGSIPYWMNKLVILLVLGTVL